MFLLGMISQALIYLCFSLILGCFILSLIPNTHRPNILVPKSAMLLSSIGIAILSFFPVLQLILYLAPNLGLVPTLQSVLLTFEVGKAWIFTFIVAIILFIFLSLFDYRTKALNSFIGIVLTLILILALGWSNHASSYHQLLGFISDTTHFTAVAVWVGILFIVSWFSTDHTNWLKFLKWFSPVAITCFIMTILTGFMLMSIVVEDYLNSWVIPYGQSLLIKHLLIIPLVIFAVINGVLIEKKVEADSNFNPLPWVKSESLLILLIFSATAALGQQSPPKETLISNESVSKLFTLINQGQIQPNMMVQLASTPSSILLIVLALIFLALMLYSFYKKMPAIMSFLMGLLFVFCTFLSLLLSIY